MPLSPAGQGPDVVALRGRRVAFHFSSSAVSSACMGLPRQQLFANSSLQLRTLHPRWVGGSTGLVNQGSAATRISICHTVGCLAIRNPNYDGFFSGQHYLSCLSNNELEFHTTCHIPWFSRSLGHRSGTPTHQSRSESAFEKALGPQVML